MMIDIEEPWLDLIAKGGGYELFRIYREREAAELIGVHSQTLKAIRRRQAIGHVAIGSRTISYLGLNIAEFVVSRIRWPQSDQNTSSGGVGWPGAKIARHGTDIGGMHSEDARAALRLAQQALTKPKGS